MAYAEKRKGRTTGKWIAEVDLPPVMGRRSRVRERFDTKSDAERWEGLVRVTGSAPARRETEQRASEGPTLGEIARALEATNGQGRWSAKNHAAASRRAVVVSYFGKVRVRRITFVMAEQFIEHLLRMPRYGKQMSPATINHYLSALSGYLKYAEQRGDIEYRPKLPWRKVKKRKQDHYEPDAERLVISKLREDGYELYAFCCEALSASGLRAGELLGLKPEQITDDGFIMLDDPEQIKNEKVRVVYIGEQMARTLRALAAGGRLPKRNTLYKRVIAAQESAGVKVSRCLHAFRHTAATRTVANEQDVQIAQELLGHRSIKTTLEYRAVNIDVLKARAKKVSPLVGETRGEVVEVDFTQPRQDIGKAS